MAGPLSRRSWSTITIKHTNNDILGTFFLTMLLQIFINPTDLLLIHSGFWFLFLRNCLCVKICMSFLYFSSALHFLFVCSILDFLYLFYYFQKYICFLMRGTERKGVDLGGQGSVEGLGRDDIEKNHNQNLFSIKRGKTNFKIRLKCQKLPKQTNKKGVSFQY